MRSEKLPDGGLFFNVAGKGKEALPGFL